MHGRGTIWASLTVHVREFCADPEEDRLHWTCSFFYIPWPVCGEDRVTYLNRCLAELHDTTVACYKPCLFCPESAA